MLQEFMDKALVSNAYEVKIIHGIGTGVLKNEVKTPTTVQRYHGNMASTPDQGG